MRGFFGSIKTSGIGLRLFSFFAALFASGTMILAADSAALNLNGETKAPPQTAIRPDNSGKASAAPNPVSETAETNLPTPPIDAAHPLYVPLQEAYKAQEALRSVKDYEAVFVKREMIKGRLLKVTMNLKVRERPFSVYMKFVDTNKGREVLYQEDRNNNQLVIHEAGLKSLAGSVFRAPNSPDVMSENRYPANLIGLKKMLDRVIRQWEDEGKFGEVKTQKRPNSHLGSGEECVVYESLHSVPRDQFKFHTTRLWIESKTGLAIRVEQLGFPQKGDKDPPLVEEYTYGNLRLNVKLSDRDFDKKNPAYAFP
jgi:hypothetical protein